MDECVTRRDRFVKSAPAAIEVLGLQNGTLRGESSYDGFHDERCVIITQFRDCPKGNHVEISMCGRAFDLPSSRFESKTGKPLDLSVAFHGRRSRSVSTVYEQLASSVFVKEGCAYVRGSSRQARGYETDTKR